MVPPLEFADFTTHSERRVATLLSQLTDDADAYAFYSVGLTRHAHKLRAEADFIVLWRGAVLILEVKGGAVARHNGVWSVRDSQGRGYTKAESPWQQAAGNMFALRDYLDDRVVGRRPPYGIVVITPDQRIPESAEWEKWEWGGPEAMSVPAMTSLLNTSAAHARRRAKVDEIPSLRAVRDALRPEFEQARLLPDIAEAIDGQMARLLEPQLEILSGLEDYPRVIVEGGAGTGKTLLAVEAAIRAASGGASVLFTCRSGGVIDLYKERLHMAGVDSVAFDQLGATAYDVVIVDEAQDIMNLEELPTLESAVKGSLDAGRWWLFLDRNNQSRIDGDFEQPAFDMLCASGVARFTLKANFRNTKNIVSQVQSYLGADLGTPRVGEGPRVRTVISRDAENADELATAKLAQLLDDGVSLRDVAVISAQDRAGVLTIAQHAIPIRTAREVKGLEFKYVLVTDIDDVEQTGTLSRMYVAMTRPRIELWMCVSRRAEKQIKELTLARLTAGKDL